MNIGLIAMSGIRCQDPELLELGLTLPGFVERSAAIASLPSLGLLTLAGATPGRHDVRYWEVADLAEMETLPERLDLVAISSFTAQILEAYELADRFRVAGVLVVLGGLHVTSLPEEAKRHADAVVVGEGGAGVAQRAGGRGGGAAEAAVHGRRRVRHGRRPDAAVRPVGRLAVQPDHGADVAGLSAEV